MAGMEIRAATLDDAGAIAEIYNLWITAGQVTADTVLKTADEIRAGMAEHTEREGYLLAVRDGEVLGWSLLKRYSDRHGYRFTAETSTYLRPEAVGRGVGTALKRAQIERARALGLHHLVARAVSDNRASIEYNLRCGYEVVGVQREANWLGGRWCDVTILQLLL
jgi:L-amino acid N-acyltransferase YncA